MKTAHSFIFDSCEIKPETGEILLNYSLDGEIGFKEKLNVADSCQLSAVSSSATRALELLHLLGGVSYYKTCCPEKMEVRSCELDENQASFFSTVYEKGLGEFMYRNELDLRGKIRFPSQRGQVLSHPPFDTAQDKPAHPKVPDPIPNPHPESASRSLVPIGGGKDSMVTIKMLQDQGRDITLLRMGSHPVIDRLVEKLDLPCITVSRTLDPTLFKLNEEGALNGHIPITAYLSALCVLLAELYGFDEVVLSNEKSASYGNTEYLGEEINHQWSKSEEFEQMFQKYIGDYINPDLKYYSALRDLTELEIVEQFCSQEKYLHDFTSCNRNWKILKDKNGEAMNPSTASGSWCGSCPKCAFVFLMMAAYLPREKVVEIFGADLFEKESLIPLYKQLLGIEGFKPFECVGTPEESIEAFSMIRSNGEYSSSPILKLYEDL